MTFLETIQKRRSIRRFTDKAIPESVMLEAFQAAILAPNSSNTQTWNFYWVQSADKKEKLVEACLSQSAARTAKELVVITANPKLWKRSQPGLIQYTESINAPQPVKMYYQKLVPMVYRWGFLNILAPIKWITANVVGLFRPMPRGPYTRRDSQEIAIKSAALACENFVLSLASNGFQTCMMEGFDEVRVKRLLKLACDERVVMVIACGDEAERGTWGPRYRMELNEVLHRV